MRRPYILIPDSVSKDTVECLQTLLHHARLGDVTGLAFTALLKRRAYIANTAGECHRDPTFARGMVAALHDQLGHRIRTGSNE